MGKNKSKHKKRALCAAGARALRVCVYDIKLISASVRWSPIGRCRGDYAPTVAADYRYLRYVVLVALVVYGAVCVSTILS